jgi:hypothetical protein
MIDVGAARQEATVDEEPASTFPTVLRGLHRDMLLLILKELLKKGEVLLAEDAHFSVDQLGTRCMKLGYGIREYRRKELRSFPIVPIKPTL